MISDRTRIGMFDSGIGGLSVLHQALKSLPEPEYLYYADTDHVPYGTRTVEEIRDFTEEIIRFLTNEGAQAVIIACNTATSAAVSLMREKYTIPIIGMEPAVKPALELAKMDAETEGAKQPDCEKRVLVLATPLTLRESKMEALIAKYDAHHLVDKLPAEELVYFAERGDFDETEILSYLQELMEPFDKEAYNSVVLGCTHFNYFLPELKKVFPEGVHFVDGVQGTLKRTADLLGLSYAKECRSAGETESVRYFFSGREVTGTDEVQKIAKLHARLDACDEKESTVQNRRTNI